jgi:putative ABC transport system permease protein
VRAPLSTLFRLAWRESRTARRRLLLYMSSISLGVAALVAIDSFAANVQRSIKEQSRTLMGGDLNLRARQTFTARADSILDSLATAGFPTAKVTSFASMASAQPSGNTRLTQVRAVGVGFPFYGEVLTEPTDRWSTLHDGRYVMVDPSLLVGLDAQIGDSLQIGLRGSRSAHRSRTSPATRASRRRWGRGCSSPSAIWPPRDCWASARAPSTRRS